MKKKKLKVRFIWNKNITKEESQEKLDKIYDILFTEMAKDEALIKKFPWLAR